MTTFEQLKQIRLSFSYMSQHKPRHLSVLEFTVWFGIGHSKNKILMSKREHKNIQQKVQTILDPIECQCKGEKLFKISLQKSYKCIHLRFTHI